MKKASRLTLPQKIIECACAAMILGMILGLLLFWSQIPDQVPGHYNSAGEIDRWGDKWELLLLPSCGVFLYCIISAVPSKTVNCPGRPTPGWREQRWSWWVLSRSSSGIAPCPGPWGRGYCR